MHRLTVVQLLPALQSGGVERSTLEVAAALVRAGHRAVVVSAGGRLVQPLLDVGGEHLTLEIGRKSLLTLRHVANLRRLFAELGADIVHARSRLPAWLGWYALRGMPGDAAAPGDHRARAQFAQPLQRSDDLRRARDLRVQDGARIRVHALPTDRSGAPEHHSARGGYRAVPAPAAAGPPRTRVGADPAAWAACRAPLLLLPGRGTRLKGHADGLQLLADVRTAGMPAFLWLPGAREPGREAYVRELEAEAARLSVADAVAFTEPTDRIAEAYAASNLVLQLSRKPEAFGRTVVEALSVGRPVLGWAHGGVGELLSELQPSGAVAAFDAQALCTQALQLLQHAPAAPAVIPYTLQAMQTATLKVYDKLRR